MRRQISELALVCLMLSGGVVGCGDDSSEPQPEKVDDSWSTLITADWTLEAAKEGYTCARITVPEDIFVKSFRPIAPLGTHHTLLTIDSNATSEDQDGVFKCNAGTNGPNMLLGS